MSLHPEFKSILDVIAPDRTRYAGMSDDQLDREHRLQKRFYSAWDEFCNAVREVNEGSAVMEISIAAVEDFAHDEIPGEPWWDAKISEARRG